MAGNFAASYFGFNRQQRNGLFVLLLISFLLLVIRLTYPLFIQPDAMVVQDLPLIERKLDSAYAAKQSAFKQYKNKSVTALFVFDPNTVSYEQLLSLGFREKTATTFLKFRSKGFVFREKQDLRKIYGISEKLYDRLEPYVLIAPLATAPAIVQEQKAAPQEKPVPAPVKPVDLNTCDSIALCSLNGIGPSYARRILKYREILGGYVSVEQVKEVYGFPEELYEKIRRLLTVTPVTVRKIDLNRDTFKTVNRHPYLSYETTKQLFDWRKKTVLTSVNVKDILNDDALYNKLSPYLAF